MAADDRFESGSCSPEHLRLSGGKRKALVVVIIIEIRPFRNGWEVYESAGVQPVCERSNLLFQMCKFVLA